MRKVLALAVMMFPGVAAAGDRVVLDGPGIDALLRGQVVAYAGATQAFMASGRTRYDTGTVSWGDWEVRGDQYCSQWPPANGWACYGVAADDLGGVRFTGESGDTTDGVLQGAN